MKITIECELKEIAALEQALKNDNSLSPLELLQKTVAQEASHDMPVNKP